MLIERANDDGAIKRTPGLTNLNFLTYTGVAPKAEFSAVKPTGWIGGDNLIFIDTPGTASNPNSACGSVYLSTYGCPSTLAIPGGYNYVEADGNPAFETGFGTIVTGLTPGQTYDLEFYQGASQQRDFVGDTTEQWIVGLGTGDHAVRWQRRWCLQYEHLKSARIRTRIRTPVSWQHHS